MLAVLVLALRTIQVVQDSQSSSVGLTLLALLLAVGLWLTGRALRFSLASN